MTVDLHPKQSLAFQSVAREMLYGGAAGGGKSHLMRVIAISLCMQVARLQVYIFRRLSDDLYKNHMEGAGGFFALLGELMESKYVSYNASKNFIKFWNGAKIHLCHCQYEKDRFKYQGAEIHVLMIDELTHFTSTIYRFLRSRVRIGQLELPEDLISKIPFILNGANPGGIGHNWVKLDFVDFAPPLIIKKADKKSGGMLRQYIPARIEDNPSLDEDYEDKLSGLGPDWLVKAMRDGDWNITAGGMFDDVWRENVHVKKSFKIPHSWKIDRSFDWGSTKPFAVTWWAESDGTDYTKKEGKEIPTQPGDLFAIHELYGWEGEPNVGVKWSAKKIAQEILKIEEVNDWGPRVVPGVADTSIFTEEDEHSIAQNMESEGVLWEKANKSPGSRKNGWALIRERLENAVNREGSGLYVFENCRQFIRTMPVLPRSERDPDDVDTESEDHIADEVRYRVLDSKPVYADEININIAM